MYIGPNPRVRFYLRPSFVLFILSLLIRQDYACGDTFNPDTHYAGLVEDGYDALLYRLHLINQAETSVDIQTFIWEDDETGHLFMNACVEAAQRGVRVRILMDHMYSDKNPQTYIALSRAHPNLQIKSYRPPGNKLNLGAASNILHAAAFFRARNQRMHNKTQIVDGRWALISGRNISNHYFNQSLERNYRDRGVLIAGPTVDDVTRSFE